MVKKCCVCSRVKMEGKWQSGIASTTDGRVSHAYCPACFSRTMAKIRRHSSCKTRNVQSMDLGGVLYGT